MFRIKTIIKEKGGGYPFVLLDYSEEGIGDMVWLKKTEAQQIGNSGCVHKVTDEIMDSKGKTLHLTTASVFIPNVTIQEDTVSGEMKLAK